MRFANWMRRREYAYGLDFHGQSELWNVQYNVFGSGQSLHTITVPLIKSCPQKPSSERDSFLSNHLSITHACTLFFTQSYAYVSSFKHQWAGISFRGNASLFVTWHQCLCGFRSENQKSQKGESTSLSSHASNCGPPAPCLITDSPSGLPEVFFPFYSSLYIYNKCLCLYEHSQVCVVWLHFLSYCQ